MLDHITLRVSDLEKSRRFYALALQPLGYEILKEGASVGFGVEDVDGKRNFWIKKGEVTGVPSFSCLAFRAPCKKSVEAFHEVGLKAGGKDNGAPGYRPKYHRGYYSAFVLDPDGYNIEVFFHDLSSGV